MAWKIPVLSEIILRHIFVILFVIAKLCKLMRKTACLKPGVGFWRDKSPHLSAAKVLIDTVGYVCLESVKCDECMCRTLGDELALSFAETLHQDE